MSNRYTLKHHGKGPSGKGRPFSVVLLVPHRSVVSMLGNMSGLAKCAAPCDITLEPLGTDTMLCRGVSSMPDASGNGGWHLELVALPVC